MPERYGDYFGLYGKTGKNIYPHPLVGWYFTAFNYYFQEEQTYFCIACYSIGCYFLFFIKPSFFSSNSSPNSGPTKPSSGAYVRKSIGPVICVFMKSANFSLLLSI